MRLACLSGAIDANIGDRFFDFGGEWEIVSFKEDEVAYEPFIGAVPTVVVKPINGMPTQCDYYANEDGTIDWCGDSVAAALLEKKDGRRRSSRGDFLRK